jgi:hypothetical protein
VRWDCVRRGAVSRTAVQTDSPHTILNRLPLRCPAHTCCSRGLTEFRAQATPCSGATPASLHAACRLDRRPGCCQPSRPMFSWFSIVCPYECRDCTVELIKHPVRPFPSKSFPTIRLHSSSYSVTHLSVTVIML